MRIIVLYFKLNLLIRVGLEDEIVELLIIEPVDLNVCNVLARLKDQPFLYSRIFILPACSVNKGVRTSLLWLVSCKDYFAERCFIVLILPHPSLIELAHCQVPFSLLLDDHLDQGVVSKVMKRLD